MHLEDLDLSKLEEKSAPDRWGRDNPELDRRTFFDPQRRLYFKVWGPLCAAHRRFISGCSAWAADIRSIFGFEIGFFTPENCPALVEFITDADGALRGYVTREGEPLPDMENPAMEKFLDEVRAATVRSGFVHNDVCYNNLVLVGGRISFIDFDTAFSDLARLDVAFESDWGALRPHALPGYTDFVRRLAAEGKETPAPLSDHLTVRAQRVPVYVEGRFIGGILHPACHEDEATSYADSDFFEETFVPHAGWFTHHARDPIAHALREGHFEGTEQAFCWLFLKSGDVFADFGSRFGVFAVLAARANDGGELFAIEENPKYEGLLRRNAEANGAANICIVKSAGPVALARVDRSRPWCEIFTSTSDEQLRTNFPALILGSTLPTGTADPDKDEDAVFRRLTAAGYVLARLDRHTLRLTPLPSISGTTGQPVFALLDLEAANRALAAADGDRVRIARDVIARSAVGRKLGELQLLEELKLRVSEDERLRKWAREAEGNLKTERQNSAELRRWAERAQTKLEGERTITQELREWAESAQAKLNEERKLTRQLREWAESAEARAAAAKLAAGKQPTDAA